MKMKSKLTSLMQKNASFKYITSSFYISSISSNDTYDRFHWKKNEVTKVIMIRQSNGMHSFTLDTN